MTGRAATSRGFPSVRFGEFGRWISLAGTLARVSALGVLMVMMLIVARAPVARVGRAALAEPLRAFVIGLAAEIFFVPLLVAAAIGLAITIIGIPFVAILVPIAIVIAMFAFVLGFTALACRIGEWIEDRLGWQPGNAFVATAIGFVLLMAPTLLARMVDVASVGARPSTLHRHGHRSDGGIPGVDDRAGRGDHDGPRPLVHRAAADHGAAGRTNRRSAGLAGQRESAGGSPSPARTWTWAFALAMTSVALLQAQDDLERARILVAMLDGVAALDRALARRVRFTVGFHG